MLKGVSVSEYLVLSLSFVSDMTARSPLEVVVCGVF
jgi:hypothetical protein